MNNHYNILRYLLTIMATAAGMFLFAGVSQAADITAGNSKTGFASTNNVNVGLVSENVVTIDNDANVDNNITINANTGNNSASMNTGNGEVRTGDADIAVAARTDVNRVELAQDQSNNDASIRAENNITGANSSNVINVNQTSTNVVDITNNADITNNINLNAETGENTADQNTGDGSVQTGDIDIKVNHGIENIANVTRLQLNSGWVDTDLDLLNRQTGFDSENNILTTLNKTSVLNLDNTLDVTNNITVDADTGDNTADQNTGDGEVGTGDINLDAEISTTGNISELWLNGWGTETDSLAVEAGNEITGALSTNDINASLTTTETLDVVNDSTLDNDIDMTTETGENTADQNTGDGEVESGGSDLELTIDNFTNETLGGEDGGDGLSGILSFEDNRISVKQNGVVIV